MARTLQTEGNAPVLEHLTDAGQRKVSTWLRTQLSTQKMTVATLAARTGICVGLIRRLLNDEDTVSVRKILVIISVLGYSPTETIDKLGLLSQRGVSFLEYCTTQSEAPLAEFWQTAKDLPIEDRALLLECMLHERRKRWIGGGHQPGQDRLGAHHSV